MEPRKKKSGRKRENNDGGSAPCMASSEFIAKLKVLERKRKKKKTNNPTIILENCSQLWQWACALCSLFFWWFHCFRTHSSGTTIQHSEWPHSANEINTKKNWNSTSALVLIERQREKHMSEILQRHLSVQFRFFYLKIFFSSKLMLSVCTSPTNHHNINCNNFTLMHRTSSRHRRQRNSVYNSLLGKWAGNSWHGTHTLLCPNQIEMNQNVYLITTQMPGNETAPFMHYLRIFITWLGA